MRSSSGLFWGIFLTKVTKDSCLWGWWWNPTPGFSCCALGVGGETPFLACSCCALGVGGETPFLACFLCLWGWRWNPIPCFLSGAQALWGDWPVVAHSWLLTVAGRSSETSKEHVSRVRSAKSASLLMMIFLIFRWMCGRCCLFFVRDFLAFRCLSGYLMFPKQAEQRLDWMLSSFFTELSLEVTSGLLVEKKNKHCFGL